MRVLIADDQKNVGTTLASLVSHCHHEVVEVVGSGLEAIQAYTRHRPDVVLMDYWMSKLNGATACRNILAKDPNARVILVSAWAPLKELDDSGAVSILPKPVDLDRLEEALNAAAALSVLPPMADSWIVADKAEDPPASPAEIPVQENTDSQPTEEPFVIPPASKNDCVIPAFRLEPVIDEAVSQPVEPTPEYTFPDLHIECVTEVVENPSEPLRFPDLHVEERSVESPAEPSEVSIAPVIRLEPNSAEDVAKPVQSAESPAAVNFRRRRTPRKRLARA